MQHDLEPSGSALCFWLNWLWRYLRRFPWIWLQFGLSWDLSKPWPRCTGANVVFKWFGSVNLYIGCGFYVFCFKVDAKMFCLPDLKQSEKGVEVCHLEHLPLLNVWESTWGEALVWTRQRTGTKWQTAPVSLWRCRHSFVGNAARQDCGSQKMNFPSMGAWL